MRELKPTTVAVFIYLQPLFATIFAVSLGKDDLSLVKLISAVLIFVGVYLVTQKASPNPSKRGELGINKITFCKTMIEIAFCKAIKVM